MSPPSTKVPSRKRPYASPVPSTKSVEDESNNKKKIKGRDSISHVIDSFFDEQNVPETMVSCTV